MFEKFGTIEGAFLIGDGTVRRGFGFVTFGAWKSPCPIRSSCRAHQIIIFQHTFQHLAHLNSVLYSRSLVCVLSPGLGVRLCRHRGGRRRRAGRARTPQTRLAHSRDPLRGAQLATRLERTRVRGPASSVAQVMCSLIFFLRARPLVLTNPPCRLFVQSVESPWWPAAPLAIAFSAAPRVVVVASSQPLASPPLVVVVVLASQSQSISLARPPLVATRIAQSLALARSFTLS